jgi:arsenical pump membrane protein
MQMPMPGNQPVTQGGGTPVSRRRVPQFFSRPRRLHPLDWVAIGLFGIGALCVATRLLPLRDADATVRRVLPLLLFLGSVIVLAELTAAAEVFDVVATRLSIIARGRFPALFLLCVALASLTTIALNLDTTAVLLTPVILALAFKIEVAPLPLAMTTVWLANTASLLLPVSNLTNLLAANRVALAPIDFARRMWAAQLAAVAVTTVLLWVLYWRSGRRGADRYVPPSRHVPAQPLLFRVAAFGCLLFVTGILVGVPIGVASSVSAGLLVIAFAVRNRSVLRPRLVPWRLLVFVTGLFLVVQTISRHGLATIVSAMVGHGDGPVGSLRAMGTGAGLSNLVNNLPAYVAGESVVPVANHTQLLALLIGTNVGPVITPWASLATLLWFERCQAWRVAVPLRRFMLSGAVLAVTGGLAATFAVLL